MKQKIREVVGLALIAAGETIMTSGGLLKVAIEKLLSKRLWTAIGGFVVAGLAPKLDIPPDQLWQYWMTIASIVGMLIAGDTFRKSDGLKPKE